MSQDLTLQDVRGLAVPKAEEAEAHRQELLRPDNLSRHIYFEGNRPHLDPAYRNEIIAATLGSILWETVADDPRGVFTKNFPFLAEFWPNVRKTRINLRYRNLIVAKLDGFDAMVTGIARIVERRVDPGLWDSVTSERLATLRDELDDLWRAYRREWAAVGLRKS